MGRDKSLRQYVHQRFSRNVSRRKLKHKEAKAYSIINNQIRLKDRVPVLVANIFSSFGRILFHTFDNVQQFFQVTCLTKCNSNAMICGHVRIYMVISLKNFKCRQFSTKYLLKLESIKMNSPKFLIITRIRLNTSRASLGLFAFPRIAKSFVKTNLQNASTFKNN